MKNRVIVMVLGILILTGVFGCVGSKRMAVIGREPTCAEASSDGIQSLTDYEYIRLLDDALAEKRMVDCWEPIVKHGLSSNRDIPHRHLAEAIKRFNTHENEPFFHMAIQRYFAGLAADPQKYRPQDARLLETYLSYLINNAQTRRDSHLARGKMICRKLDRRLYARLFE